ncbi:MAG: phosphoenolpyruvate--protein phosphotransferase [Candidatus Omnitrophica bacterium]|nr:phosphoenolpyruvate--protein phosphotransferase [Candidatus Omnitrophota bacterium]
MKLLKGIAASAGIAVGKALLLDHEDLRVPPRPVDEAAVPNEIMRFEDALTRTRAQILKIQNQITKELGREHAEIFDAHLMLIEDRTLIEEVIGQLKKTRLSVEYVFSQALRKYTAALAKVGDEYLRERVADINDVGRRILRNLMGERGTRIDQLTERVVLIAYDLSPSDTAVMHKRDVIGFATDIGGRTSHTAIMAKSREVPAVVGLENVTQLIKDGDEVIIDGIDGVVVINPDRDTREAYLTKREEYIASGREFMKIKDSPAVTLDKRKIALCANLELPDEIESIQSHGAEGIGLFRTEYLFLNRKTLPNEEEQFFSYKTVVAQMKPRPVTIRTLDLGGDKFLSQLEMPREMNPFLGWRAIRFCLAMPEIFKPQLRAILRASAFGKTRLMYPMISGLEELRAANDLLNDCKRELHKKGVPYDPKIELGAMIEIPSAALTCDLLADEVSFFSIGTNDLIQYALAADRVNEKIAYLYDPAHPAVLRLLRNIIVSGHRKKMRVSMCGEMAGDPELTIILVGLGLDEMSISAVLLPEIKAIIRSIKFSTAQRIAKEALKFRTGKEVMSFAREHFRQLSKGKSFYGNLRDRREETA